MIAIMGVTGSGKSTFISLLTDGSAPVGHSLEACKSPLPTKQPLSQSGISLAVVILIISAGTSEIGIYSYHHSGGKKVYLIDTPGFDDTFRSDTEVLKEIAFSLAALYSKGIKLAGLLYLHRITDRRMQGSALKSMHMLKAVCGESSFPNVVLITTMWNLLEQSEGSLDSGAQRESELRSNDNFWGAMEKGGSRIIRHFGDWQSAFSIVSFLFDKKSRVVLDIQRQMVDEEKGLNETTAGQFVQKELLEARQRYERDIAEYQQSIDDALKEKDADMATILQEQREEHGAKVSEIIASERDLKVNLPQLMEEKDNQYTARQLDWEKSSSVGMARYEDKLRKFQDEVDRKDVEHRREMALLRKEAQAKSAEVAMQLESVIRAKEKQWLAQHLENQRQIQSERAMWQAREHELLEARKEAEDNNPMVVFGRYIFSKSRGEGRKGPRDIRNKERSGLPRGGEDIYDRDWHYDRDTTLVRHQGGRHPHHDNDRYERAPSASYQAGRDLYDSKDRSGARPA